MTDNRTTPSELTAFCVDLLATHGVNAGQAAAVADNLVWSELVGRKNFGFLRLPLYLDRLAAGGLNGDCRPCFEERAPGIALLDADQGFGQYAGMLAMERAVNLARSQGFGVVAVRNSNFFGTGAYFVHQASEAGMIGLAASNSFPKVVAHGGRLPVFGTNPFAFGAPQRDGKSIMIDMSTSAMAGSTVRRHIDAGEPLPAGLAIDANGRPITDPHKVQDGALLPFGNAKGYCLALMVEILAGVLTGAGISKGVSSMYEDVADSGDNGHFLMALDISRFMPIEVYYDRIEGLLALIRASGAGEEVQLPGDNRWQHRDDGLSKGLELPSHVRLALERASEPHGIVPPWLANAMAG